MGCAKSAEQVVHPEHSCNKVLLGAIFDNAHLPEIKDAALTWCEEASLEDAEAVLSSEQRLSEELGLKVLERKRLLVALGGDPSIAAFDEISEPPPKHLSQAVGAVTMHLRIRMITGNVLDVNANASDSVLTTKTKLRQLRRAHTEAECILDSRRNILDNIE